jgi:hypothetical protein
MLPDDLFDFFRRWLGIVATIYATVITLQSLWGWWVWLAGEDKYISLLRRYLIVHGLRLRFKTFWGDVIICGLLCVVFLILWHAHGLIYDLDRIVQDVRRLPS